MKTNHIYLESYPQLPDDNAARMSLPGKTEMLAGVMDNRELMESIGAAWRLYFRLVLNENGTMTTTRSQLGSILGTKETTVRNWIDDLKNKNIITAETTGKQIRITLTKEHMAIAKAPEVVIETQTVSSGSLSPRLQAFQKIVEAADLSGNPIEVKLVI